MDMMTIRRRVLMWQKKALDCDGSFYFKTEYVPTDKTHISVTFSVYDNNVVNNPLFGARNTASYNSFLGWASIDRVGTLRVQRMENGYPTYGNISYTVNPSEPYVINTEEKGLFKNGELIVPLNGDAFDDSYRGGEYPFYLLAVNNSNSVVGNCCFVGKFYNFKIYENSIVVANYIPHNDGLKDTVSGTILTPTYK